MIHTVCDQELPEQGDRSRLRGRESEGLSGRPGQGVASEASLPQRSRRSRRLEVASGNRLEALAGDRKGQHSIRINDQFRVCFVWTADGAAEVEIVDYH